MNTDELSASSLCARLYHVILEAFRNSISCTKDPQILSKLQSCGQRFKLWAAGLRIENGDLDAQLDKDADMKDSVLLLLGLILYDLYKTHKHIQPENSVSISRNTGNVHGSSLLTARSLQDIGNLEDVVQENSEKPSNLSRNFDPSFFSASFDAGPSDEPYIEDTAQWIASLTYICPNLQSFFTDSDLEEMNSLGPSDAAPEELVIELVEDIVDTVQQLYDLGPSLAWEVMLPKTEDDPESERQRQIEGEDSMEEGVIHYLRLTQDKFSHISSRLALRLAKANWARFQRLETARNAKEAERIRMVSRKARDESHADSGYYTGFKSGKLQGQDGSARLRDESGTEYGSVYSSMDRFGAQGRLCFPAPPMTQPGLDHGKVDCTVCGSTVGPFRNKREWRLHVVRDLAPYVCPVLQCESKQIVFDSHRSFTTHLRRHQDFSTSWRCQFSQCDTQFGELGSFQDHVQSAHGISEGEDTEHMCDAWAESTGMNWEEITCPICDGSMNASLVQKSKHLGHHMIELALLSIPNHSLDPDDSENSYSKLDDASDSSLDFLESRTKDKEEANTAESAQKSMLEQGESFIDEKVNLVGPDQQSTSPTPKAQKEREVVVLKDPITHVSRPASTEEIWALYAFELHAQKCAYCHDPYKVHHKHKKLCEVGHKLAQKVCALLYKSTDGKIYSTSEEDRKLVPVEIPTGYDQSKGLLKAVELSLRLRSTLNFVSMDGSSYVARSRSRSMRLEQPKQTELLRPGKIVETGVKRLSGRSSKIPNKDPWGPRPGDIVDRMKVQVSSPELQASGAQTSLRSKRGALYEEDIASQKRSADEYNVEIRKPSRRDLLENRLSGYYR